MTTKKIHKQRQNVPFRVKVRLQELRSFLIRETLEGNATAMKLLGDMPRSMKEEA